MIAAIVLAAGESRRLGTPKQLVKHDGVSLLRRTVDAAVGAGCRPVLAVLGAHADRVRPEVPSGVADVVLHEGWRAGMGSSIAAGVRALMSGWPAAEAVVLLACDQRDIAAAIVRRLIDRFDDRCGRRVACRYAGTIGVPAVFDRDLFPELAALDGDRGAKALLTREPERLLTIEWPGGAADVDEPPAPG